LDEEGRDFKEGVKLVEGYSGSVQKVCTNWKYGKDVSMGYAEKTIRAGWRLHQKLAEIVA
jgi:hypothetical protein